MTATEATATTEASTSTEATSEAAAATKSATATEASRSASKTIFANFKVTTLPIIAIELINSIPCIIHSLKCNNTRALRATIRRNVYVGTED